MTPPLLFKPERLLCPPMADIFAASLGRGSYDIHGGETKEVVG